VDLINREWSAENATGGAVNHDCAETQCTCCSLATATYASSSAIGPNRGKCPVFNGIQCACSSVYLERSAAISGAS